MALHDSRHKQLHQHEPIIQAWVRHLSHRMGLGAVDPRSVKKQSVEYVTRELTIRMADLAWTFRTEQGQGLLFMAEFQSWDDAWLALRQHVYALCHLLAGVQAREYRLGPGQGLPVPVLVSLYTGARPWQPRPLANLFQPPLAGGFPFPWFHYDMLRTDPAALPPVLDKIFDVERRTAARTPNLEVPLRAARAEGWDPALQRILFDFAVASLRQREQGRHPDGSAADIAIEWEQIRTLEELTMAQSAIQERLDSWIQEGIEQGQAQAMRETLLDLAAVRLGPQDLDLCRAGLADMSLDDMPSATTVAQMVFAPDDTREELLALLHPPVSPQ